MSQSTKTITTELPTYLKALLDEDLTVKLVCREEKDAELQQNAHTEKNPDNTEVSNLDLTGTPLQTDLGGDDSICGDLIAERPPSWTVREAKQHPLTLIHARKVINEYLQSNITTVPMFCICDGNDSLRTVVTGVKVFNKTMTRTLVYILPCCGNQDTVTTTDWMIKQHHKYSRKNEKFSWETTKKYNLFGYSLKNCKSIDNAAYNGHVSLEVISDPRSDFKMNFEAIIGHNRSPVKKFWEELSLLQSYISILSNNNTNESTVINLENILDCDEIAAIISNIIKHVSLKEWSRKDLDLKNLRHEDILDKLWDTLKHCETLSDLRETILFFFEELSQSPTKKMISTEDKSVMAELVNAIMDCKIAIPTLNFVQSLELLVQFGLEKLKNDYIVIINNFYGMAKSTIEKEWSQWNSKSSAVNVANSRISINPRAPITSLENNKLKLSYLYSLHKFTEFIFIYKENLPMLEECFHSFCMSLFKQFVVNFRKNSDMRLQLCQFSSNISFADAEKFIKNAFLTAWSVKMVSQQLTTIFHFSEHPIFPPSIYDRYDIKYECNDDQNLYVTKVMIVTD
ncbi:unnamed protein product [Tenebrio molitor]|nr:unnamed protein product [Tenebrio molitor]